ncbi:MAG TPA: hypothetical protein VI454_20890, partial [Verrucomicrobiae bacterium]
GVAMQQETQSKEQRWDWATQWSLPKSEGLRVIIPGLFGYRLDTPAGGNYWGRVGQQPGWDEHHQGFPRHSGSGEYAGVLVVLIALWGLARAFRTNGSPYTPVERRYILFWAGAAFVSLLLAFGRHAPFYQLVFQLPYFSTIRNPMKFMHPFHLALLILFGYGLHGLSRLYVERSLSIASSITDQLRNWWGKLAGFDKNWMTGSLAALGASVLAWLLYAGSRANLIRHLEQSGFPGELGESIARFSIGEVGVFVLFFAISVALVACLMSGMFSGRRAKFAAVAMGLLLVVDLGRADAPWIVFQNYKEKYASNPVIDFLRERPVEQRVTILPYNFGQQFQFFQQYYNVEWAQHHFMYYNIPGIDVTQMAREPMDFAAYRGVRGGAFSLTNSAVQPRFWELTSTRYMFAPAGIEGPFNQQFDPVQRRFKTRLLFNLTQHPDGSVSGAVTNNTGPFAILEFTGALPRAKLYAHWEVNTNDQATLKTLASPVFDPRHTVIVDEGMTTNAPPDAHARNAGTVEFSSYAPRKIILKARAESPAVLLLNDKFDPGWKVWVDGQAQTVLRCNFIMRGVALPTGAHTVEFRFEPKSELLPVSIAAILVGLLLTAFVMLRREPEPPVETVPAPTSAAPPKK